MIYYFAGTEGEKNNKVWTFLLEKKYPNILLSYYYINKINLNYLKDKKFNILLDSGAFTAFTKNKIISIDQYISFLNENKWIKNYITLDVINNPDKTLENLDILKSNNLNPIPVFHMGSNLKDLYKIIDRGYKYIALGGMAINSASNKKNIINFCYKVFEETKNIDLYFHGLGIGSPEIISMFNWYSVDSTTYLCLRKWLRHPFGRSHEEFKVFSSKEKVLFSINEIIKWLNISY
jgi:hypothetical protein